MLLDDCKSVLVVLLIVVAQIPHFSESRGAGRAGRTSHHSETGKTGATPQAAAQTGKRPDSAASGSAQTAATSPLGLAQRGHQRGHSSSSSKNGTSAHMLQRKRRQTGDATQTTSYKKKVTIQEDGKEPVEKSYEWSSSSGLPSSSGGGGGGGVSGDNSHAFSETIRKITKETLTEDNLIDRKPISLEGDRLAESKLPEPSEAERASSERISYNVTLIQERGPARSSLGAPPEGARKFTCPENHYGNLVIGCRKCQCNDNIDPTELGNCDPLTGKCLKCLYNTQGDHCDICRANYTGVAARQQCRECVCNQLGTEANGPACHPLTGQCSCKAHVEGLDCGRCKPGYFNFASGQGCQACQCEPLGSLTKTCNAFDGKCECRPGFGGQHCGECPAGQHGDPKLRCSACACNREGSLNQLCEPRTGRCQCQPGAGGDKCDRCARGYFGRFPNCESCGECFEQWAELIGALRNQTQALLERVRLLLRIGTTGAYAKEFSKIERDLDRIQQILEGQRLDEAAVRELARQIEQLGKLLRALEKQLSEYENEANSTYNRTLVVQAALRDFDGLSSKLTLLVDGLRENATQFKEWNVDGAYATILESQNRSREAEKRVRDLKPLMVEQEQKRRLTESMLISTASRYNSSSLQNEAILSGLAHQIGELEANVPAINQLVCASSSGVSSCDQLCGGALCNKCGGLSCSEGATTKAANALSLAQQAMELLNAKLAQAKLQVEELLGAKNMSESALRQAKLVMGECELQKAKFDRMGGELNGIMDGVDKFALMDGARPAEVRTLGEECLALSISLKPEQILDLARRINETISSLTNIDKILQDTAGDLSTAEQLHKQADRAKEAADNILETVEQVLRMLQLAALEQARAAAAIAAATKDIEGANADLLEITSETEMLTRLVLDLAEAVKRLKDRLNELRKKYAQNELYVSQAKAAAEDASKLADQAEKGANELEDKVKLAEEKLRNKARLNGEMKDRAERLRSDAFQLADEIRARMDLLRELDDMFDENVKRVKDYQDIIDDLHKQMNQYLKDIDARAQFYRDCQT